MQQLLFWYSKNNSIIIQSLSIIIGLLLCFFIFRLFFRSRSTEDSSELNSDAFHGLSKATESIENKINQILESQSQKKTLSDLSGESSAVVLESLGQAAVFQIENLQTEISNLKEALLKSEQKQQQQPTPQVLNTEESVLGSEVLSSVSGSTDNTIDLNQQIEDLKSRLSDYEVISEDIADLHKLREENQKLLTQLQEFKNQTQPQLDAESAANKTSSPASEDVASLLESLTDDLNIDKTSEVSDQDKDLMQQFEKIKG